jgi:hypothetical protein
MMSGFKLTSGGSSGYVLTRGSGGAGTWQAIPHRWSKNGSKIYYNSGNVGIGKSSPGKKLDVNGDIRVPNNKKMYFGNAFIEGFNNGYDGIKLYGNGGGYENLGITVDPSGRIGIMKSSASCPLDVNGTVQMTGFRLTDGAADNYVLTSDADGNGIWEPAGGGGGTSWWLSNGEDDIYYGVDSGNVGIGVSSPEEKLVVNGNLKIKGSSRKIIVGGSGPFILAGNPSTYGFGASLKLNEASNAYLYGGEGGGEEHDVILAHTGSESWGNVGIGTDNPQSRLTVNGTITAEEIEVQVDIQPDFVFEENYKLMPLNRLEKVIKKEKSLPGIPTSKEAVENGVKLGDMQSKLLQKVEELTLYVIEQNKELSELKKEVGDLRTENKELRQKISSLSN